MVKQQVSWDRLVRYVTKDGQQIRYGQPCLKHDQADQVAQLADQGRLRVLVFEGSDPFSASPSNETEVVGKLLGPLEPRNVPIIRCIGLNYKTHSAASMTLN
jgi:hypothetical protein